MEREALVRKWIDEIQNTNLEGLELLEKLFGGISSKEEFNVNTTPERIEEIKAIRAKKEAEEKEKNEQERRNKPNPYALNETMELLGHQCLLSILDDYRDTINEVMQARKYEGTFSVCVDMFSLGIICGKRIDRKRRKEIAANRGR